MKSLYDVNIDCELFLYLAFNNIHGCIQCKPIKFNSIQKNSENKYLFFASTDKNKEILEK